MLRSLFRCHFRPLQLRHYVRGRREYDHSSSSESDSASTGQNSDGRGGNQPTSSKSPPISALLDDAVTDYLKVETAEQQDPWSTPPYPKNAVLHPQRDQSVHSVRPGVDPQETSIFLFPGQGAQYIGMVKDLFNYPNVPELFRCASDILGYDLAKLCMEGPEGDLNKTLYCQPAIFVTSLASVEKLKAREPVAVTTCVAAAGFSVGEISALVFADAISFEDGVHLIKARAEAMQRASEQEPSGLMSVFVRPDSRLKEALAEAIKHMKSKGYTTPVCQISNYLFTQMKVIGGHEMALQFIEQNAGDWNLRCKRIPVNGAFHTPLMNEAYEGMKEIVKSLKIVQPLIPVHNNIDGRVYRSPEMIKRYLPKQVISAVRWEQLMHIIYSRDEGQRFPRTYEVSPGRQLGTMLKRTNAKAAHSYVCVDDATYSE